MKCRFDVDLVRLSQIQIFGFSNFFNFCIFSSEATASRNQGVSSEQDDTSQGTDRDPDPEVRPLADVFFIFFSHSVLMNSKLIILQVYHHKS